MKAAAVYSREGFLNLLRKRGEGSMVKEEMKVGDNGPIVPEEGKHVGVGANGLLGGGADKLVALKLEEVIVISAPGERSGKGVASHARGSINSGRGEPRIAKLAKLLQVGQ